jgi:hypothetical protein
MTMTNKQQQYPKRKMPPGGTRAFPITSRKTTGESQLPIAKDRDFGSPAPNSAWRVALMNDRRLLSQLPIDSARRTPTLAKIGG